MTTAAPSSDPMRDLIPAPAAVRVPVRGRTLTGDFPVRRIYCVGSNFADHAKEMGAAAPASKAERGTPVFFLKPTDSLVIGGVAAYPPGTRDLHHEIELVAALGRDAPPGVLDPADAAALVFGYGIGLDLTRRDLQTQAKQKGLPWDTGKSFDDAAPISALLPAADVGALAPRTLSLKVNGTLRQQSTLDQLIWDVSEILHELSKLYALKAGDLIFMGTPAGVAALQPGDVCEGALDDLLRLDCRIAPPR